MTRSSLPSRGAVPHLPDGVTVNDDEPAPRLVGTVEAAVLAGVTVRQLNHWAACGYLRPLRVGGGRGGQGTQWQWDERDVAAAARFGALSSALGGGRGLLLTFAQQLAARELDDQEAVGVMLDEGRFTVTVEVRRA